MMPHADRTPRGDTSPGRVVRAGDYLVLRQAFATSSLAHEATRLERDDAMRAVVAEVRQRLDARGVLTGIVDQVVTDAAFGAFELQVVLVVEAAPVETRAGELGLAPAVPVVLLVAVVLIVGAAAAVAITWSIERTHEAHVEAFTSAEYREALGLVAGPAGDVSDAIQVVAVAAVLVVLLLTLTPKL
jgi:hypothetical protein